MGVCWYGDHSGNVNCCVKVTRRLLFGLSVTLRVKLTIYPYNIDVTLAIESITFISRSHGGHKLTLAQSWERYCTCSHNGHSYITQSPSSNICIKGLISTIQVTLYDFIFARKNIPFPLASDYFNSESFVNIWLKKSNQLYLKSKGIGMIFKFLNSFVMLELGGPLQMILKTSFWQIKICSNS